MYPLQYDFNTHHNITDLEVHGTVRNKNSDSQMLIQNPKCAMMRQICQPKASDRAGNFTFDRRLNIKDAINDCSEMVIMNVQCRL